MSNTPKNYAYPVGDFLSGFSEDEKNPCDYELECQRMVIRGVEYFDNHPDLHEWISLNSVNAFHQKLKPLLDYMCDNPDAKEGAEQGGQTGAMVSHTVYHAYQSKKLGWEEYIKQLTAKDDE
jgi:hypothetical protein